MASCIHTLPRLRVLMSTPCLASAPQYNSRRTCQNPIWFFTRKCFTFKKLHNLLESLCLLGQNHSPAQSVAPVRFVHPMTPNYLIWQPWWQQNFEVEQAPKTNRSLVWQGLNALKCSKKYPRLPILIKNIIFFLPSSQSIFIILNLHNVNWMKTSTSLQRCHAYTKNFHIFGAINTSKFNILGSINSIFDLIVAHTPT